MTQAKQRRLHRATSVLAGRTRALDTTTLAQLYADLTDRAWYALAEVKARARTGDEDTGHQFHGNQWTGGLGAKPKTITAKTSKAGVHELLSSGHPFTKQELMEVCGIKSEKLLSDYLAMLKNPKYAGPKGALSIQQKDGHYFVAMPNSQPAPPLEKATEKMTPASGEHDIPIPTEPLPDLMPETKHEVSEELLAAMKPQHPHEKATIVDPTDAYELQDDEDPPPEVVAAVGNAIKQQSAMEALKGAHPGSMPSSEADKHYAHAMEAAQDALKADLDPSSPKSAHEAVLTFKNSKAEAMAAWATAVHGKPYAPKTQAVFKADMQLAMDVGGGMDMSQAIAVWKQNTAAEKAGNFPPKAATPAAKAAAAKEEPPETITDMGHAAHVKPIDYDSIVPAGHEHIGPDDFLGSTGWAEGMSKLNGDLSAESTKEAQGNKKEVEHRLRERLKDKPNFQALEKRLGLAKSGYASLISRLVGSWASSSGDGNPLSVSLQMAVRDAFAIPDGHIEKKALAALKNHGDDVNALTAAGIQQLNNNIKSLQPHEIQTARAALQEFIHAQYEETQEFLKSKGHDHVYLARGMKFNANHSNGNGPANVKLQPASSFSVDYGIADNFSGSHGTVFLVKVPRQQVLGTYMTGFGCTGEHEVVVLAHNSLKAYTVPSNAYGPSAASKKVAQELMAAKAGKPAPGSLEEHTAKILAQMKASEKLAAASKPKPATATYHPDAGNYAEKHAALKKAVINAKSKALKAKQAAEKKFAGDLAKAAHAAKAAEEAKAAVANLQSFLTEWKGKK